MLCRVRRVSSENVFPGSSRSSSRSSSGPSCRTEGGLYARQDLLSCSLSKDRITLAYGRPEGKAFSFRGAGVRLAQVKITIKEEQGTTTFLHEYGDGEWRELSFWEGFGFSLFAFFYDKHEYDDRLLRAMGRAKLPVRHDLTTEGLRIAFLDSIEVSPP